MATRQEMIKWLKAKHPEMCKHQKIDSLVTDSSEIKDLGVSGANTVHSLYIAYHGGCDTWDTLTESEKDAIYDTIATINRFFYSPENDGDPPEFNTDEMKNGWIYADKGGHRLGISAG